MITAIARRSDPWEQRSPPVETTQALESDRGQLALEEGPRQPRPRFGVGVPEKRRAGREECALLLRGLLDLYDQLGGAPGCGGVGGDTRAHGPVVVIGEARPRPRLSV